MCGTAARHGSSGVSWFQHEKRLGIISAARRCGGIHDDDMCSGCRSRGHLSMRNLSMI